MAINPGFAFTDAVPAQQAVQMFQIEQAARDAMRRNAMENIRTYGQQNIERDRTNKQQAITQSQLAQRDRELAQSQNQFDAGLASRERIAGENTKLYEKDAQAKRDDANRITSDRSELELFRALEAEVSGDDPPTDLEFESRALGLNPQRKSILDRIRRSTFEQLNRDADIADTAASRWNTMLSAAPDELAKGKVIQAFDKSRDKNFVQLDASGSGFSSLVRRPRTDQAYGPHLGPVGAAPVGGPSVTQIASIMNQPKPSSGGFWDSVGRASSPWRWGEYFSGSGQPQPSIPVAAPPVTMSRITPSINANAIPRSAYIDLPKSPPVYGPEPAPQEPQLLYPQYLLNGLRPR